MICASRLLMVHLAVVRFHQARLVHGSRIGFVHGATGSVLGCTGREVRWHMVRVLGSFMGPPRRCSASPGARCAGAWFAYLGLFMVSPGRCSVALGARCVGAWFAYWVRSWGHRAVLDFISREVRRRMMCARGSTPSALDATYGGICAAQLNSVRVCARGVHELRTGSAHRTASDGVALGGSAVGDGEAFPLMVVQYRRAEWYGVVLMGATATGTPKVEACTMSPLPA